MTPRSRRLLVLAGPPLALCFLLLVADVVLSIDAASELARVRAEVAKDEVPAPNLSSGYGLVADLLREATRAQPEYRRFAKPGSENDGADPALVKRFLDDTRGVFQGLQEVTRKPGWVFDADRTKDLETLLAFVAVRARLEAIFRHPDLALDTIAVGFAAARAKQTGPWGELLSGTALAVVLSREVSEAACAGFVVGLAPVRWNEAWVERVLAHRAKTVDEFETRRRQRSLRETLCPWLLDYDERAFLELSGRTVAAARLDLDAARAQWLALETEVERLPRLYAVTRVTKPSPLGDSCRRAHWVDEVRSLCRTAVELRLTRLRAGAYPERCPTASFRCERREKGFVLANAQLRFEVAR